MKEIVVELTVMAHGGPAMGRDENGRPVFIPFTIPGETVRARLTDEKKRFARAELTEVLQPAPERAPPRCPHFGVCGGCHWQHITYEKQLAWKQAVVADQLARLGGLSDVNVAPTLANPTPWAYRSEISLSPTPDGRLGFWSPSESEVIPIDACPILRPELWQLWQDIDLDLPGLRKLTLRLADDGARLAAFEVDGVEPPQLSVDFPLSVAIILPDNTAASLVGDHYLVQQVGERDFRVSPGCAFPPSPAAAPLLVETVLAYAALTGAETVLEAYSGVGLLTAFLAPDAADLIAMEQNPDAVADATVNLAEFDHIRLYEGDAADLLPGLEIKPEEDILPEVVVVSPPAGTGLETAVCRTLGQLAADRLIYVSNDLAALARDARELSAAGYRLQAVQPIDMTPHHFQIDTVSLWQTKR